MAVPVVFIHGPWLHSSSWEPWEHLFRDGGYRPMSPGWPGEGDTVEATREAPESIADHGVDEVVAHYGTIIETLDHAPVLVGHWFGGMVARRLLGQDRAAAAIAIDGGGVDGVLPVPSSAPLSASPELRHPSNGQRAISLTAEQFRASFGNALGPAEADALFDRWTIPASAKALFEAAAADSSPYAPAEVSEDGDDRGPLLLIISSQGHSAPAAVTVSTLGQRPHTAETDLIEFPDRGRSLTIDSGWREVAEACLRWLGSHDL